jgi:hypothetical protein
MLYDAQESPEKENKPQLNKFGKPVSPSKPTRSIHSMSNKGGFYQIDWTNEPVQEGLNEWHEEYRKK